jgi:non-lysosomal glucosylceramidase
MNRASAFTALLLIGLNGKAAFLCAQTDASTLAQLTFQNSGTVTRDMEFRYFHQPDDYLETPDQWDIIADGTYLYRVDGHVKRSPPDGIRSAVPLGGLGSGTLELRADGSLCDWNIFNNSPAYGAKVQLDDALFGIRTAGSGQPAYVSTLRTQPPQGLPAIQQIQYSGDFPVSRLRFSDPKLPVSLDLYAYSEFKPHDVNASSTPAAIFTFLLKNTSRQTVRTSLLFILPNHIDGHAQLNGGLSFVRDLRLPLSGSMTVHSVGAGAISETATASKLDTIWNAFASGRSINQASMADEAPRFGAQESTVEIPPNQVVAVTFILAWYFPNRPYLAENAGNYYATLYSSANDVADKVAARLEDDWRAMFSWQEVVRANSLPDWLQDSLANSLATMYKTGMHFRDGRWRQWESFSCPDVDPGHIDFYQSLPYMFFFPELRKQILSRFAEIQQPDGFIPEELIEGGPPSKSMLPGTAPLDHPGGRVMGDSASVFMLGVWQYYLWTGDRAFLDSMWPHIRAAALWQIQRSKDFGLPEYLQTTYDLFNFDKKTLVSYNAVLHLASLLAADRIAQIELDHDSSGRFSSAFAAGQNSLEEHLWTGKYFRAWWSDGQPSPDGLLADTLYGQLWASMLNLGLVTDKEKLVSHLRSEAELNSNQFGLRVLSGADPNGGDVGNPTTPWLPNHSVLNNNIIWPAGSVDWGILEILLGGDVKRGEAEVAKVISNQRLRLSDQWDYTDLVNNWDGGPWGNSHYTRQLIFWAVPLAISGQQWDAATERLTFNPADKTVKSLPFFTPQAAGVIDSVSEGKWRIRFTSGEIHLRTVDITGSGWTGDRNFKAGDSLELNSQTSGSRNP